MTALLRNCFSVLMYVSKVKAPGLMAPYNNDDCRRRGKRV